MPATVNWMNERKCAICQRYDGLWDQEDVLRVATETYGMMASVDHSVDVVVDLTGDRMRPETAFHLMRNATQDVETRVHPNQQRLIIVRPSLLLRLAVQMGRRCAPRATAGIIFVETMGEAMTYLCVADPEIA